jgi:hypothetical protein
MLAFGSTLTTQGLICLADAVPDAPEEENEAGLLLAEREVPV